MGKTSDPVLAALRARIREIEDGGRLDGHAARHGGPRTLGFGVDTLDRHLPGGGLRLGALHEVLGGALDASHAAAACLFVAGIAARLDGPVLWVSRSRDLFAPGLAGAGLHPGRVLHAEAVDEAGVLALAEEGLRAPQLGAVVAELARLSMVASRRLQLAAEASGVTMLAIRRWAGLGGARSGGVSGEGWSSGARGGGGMSGRVVSGGGQTEGAAAGGVMADGTLAGGVIADGLRAGGPMSGEAQAGGMQADWALAGGRLAGGVRTSEAPAGGAMTGGGGTVAGGAVTGGAIAGGAVGRAGIGGARTGGAAVPPTAAHTRWRISPAPSAPLAVPGVGRVRWRVELLRCRGADAAEWLLEGCDEAGRLAVPAELADRPAEAHEPLRRSA